MAGNPVDDLMRQGLREKVFPGAVLLVGKGDQPVFFEAYGVADLFARRPMGRDTVFDLASLTKPLATALAVVKLADEGRLDLDRPVAKWLPELGGGEKASITARQLLCHQSGYPAHRRFYMILKSLPPGQRRSAVAALLSRTALVYRPGCGRLYSDLGFMLLCRLVKAVSGCLMHHFLKAEVYDRMGIADLFFVDLMAGGPPCRPFAATEFCPMRNRLLIGEVHDDNAWFAGGVDGHAGLFGTALAVFEALRRLVAGYHGQGSTHTAVFSKSILTQLFHGVKTDPTPLGFDRPSLPQSSAGRFFSAQTVGHLGFTGVSFWEDLAQDVTVILLTNRVHPFRWNTRLTQFRPQIHDRIMEHFEFYSD